MSGGYPRIIYSAGTRLGRLTVLPEGGIKILPNGRTTFAYRCRCDCGKEIIVAPGNLKKGTKSCGCFRRDRMSSHIIHGGARRGKKSKLYKTWSNIRYRCLCPQAKGYKNYGGRGIKICPEWNSFEQFVRDMGPPPEISRRYSIGRKDTNGDYTPANCRWEIPPQQTRNKRRQYHRYLTAFGETKILAEWAEDSRCLATKNALKCRLRRGFSDLDALITPMRR